MAGGTFPDYRAVIEACSAPAIDGMTVIAEIAAGNMLRIFSGCADIVVALAAVNRCALELAASVAARTIDEFMLPGERKAGREMVKPGRLVGG